MKTGTWTYHASLLSYPKVKSLFTRMQQNLVNTTQNLISYLTENTANFHYKHRSASKFHCFAVHFDSLSFIHTNSCTFS